MHEGSDLLREVLVFLAAAGVVVPILQRLRISPVLGFLIVGVVVGPFGLARFSEAAPWLHHVSIGDPESVRAIAELGVVFLLFMIGLELSLERLRAMRRLVFGLGGAQVLVTGTVIGLIASWFGNSPATSIVLGAAFALSSTAVVMQLLSEGGRMASPTGRTGFAILLFQDLAVLPILFLVVALAAQGDGSPGLAFALAMGQALVAVVVILVVGRFVIRPVFRVLGRESGPEMFLALVLLLIIGIAVATEMAGLSMALGAFLAGLLMAETDYRHQIEVDIEPFKGLLLGLFFVSVGMSIDIASLANRPEWLLASVIGLVIIKTPIILVLARAFGQPLPVAVETGILLFQGGEFAFLVVAMALDVGLMPEETAQFMLIVASLSMMVTPLLANLGMRLALRLEDRSAKRGVTGMEIADGLTEHVIVVGYGRVGRSVAGTLSSQEIDHISIDIDAARVARYRREGRGVVFGDASHPEMLKRLGADKALALVVTLDRQTDAERIVEAASHNWPDLVIHARARDNAHATRLTTRGADRVVPEALEAGLHLAEGLLIDIGMPQTAARQAIEARRQLAQADLQERLDKASNRKPV